jgi:hypothetical protein
MYLLGYRRTQRKETWRICSIFNPQQLTVSSLPDDDYDMDLQFFAVNADPELKEAYVFLLGNEERFEKLETSYGAERMG